MVPNPDIDHLIILNLRNQASDIQKQELEKWLNISDANKELYDHLKEIWNQPAERRIDHKIKEKRDRIWMAGTAAHKPYTNVHCFEAPRVLNIIYWSKIAATFLIVALSLWIIYQLDIQNDVLERSQYTDAVTLIEKYNPAGQKSIHMLPDGSQVWLNSASQLIYPEKFSDTVRQVKLTGEAFFEVAHNANKPFIVKASGTRTEALGTAFNIQGYEEDGTIKVALLNGKVRVGTSSKVQQTSVLVPGEELLISKNGAEITRRKFNFEETFGWKQGLLVFDGVDFKTFCKIIEKWYGVQVKVIGSPKTAWDLRAQYSNESLRLVLRDINFNKDFRFELNDKELLIKF